MTNKVCNHASHCSLSLWATQTVALPGNFPVSTPQGRPFTGAGCTGPRLQGPEMLYMSSSDVSMCVSPSLTMPHNQRFESGVCCQVLQQRQGAGEVSCLEPLEHHVLFLSKGNVYLFRGTCTHRSSKISSIPQFLIHL